MSSLCHYSLRYVYGCSVMIDETHVIFHSKMNEVKGHSFTKINTKVKVEYC